MVSFGCVRRANVFERASDHQIRKKTAIAEIASEIAHIRQCVRKVMLCNIKGVRCSICVPIIWPSHHAVALDSFGEPSVGIDQGALKQAPRGCNDIGNEVRYFVRAAEARDLVLDEHATFGLFH